MVLRHRRILATSLLLISLSWLVLPFQVWGQAASGPNPAAEKAVQQERDRIERERMRIEQEQERAATQAAAEAVVKAKLERQKALAAVEEVSNVLAEIQKELQAWEGDVLPLLTNDPGRALAAQPELVQAFRASFEGTKLPKPAEVEALTQNLNTVAEPLRSAQNDPAYEPGTTLKATIAELQATAEAMLKACRMPRLTIQALVSSVKSSGQPGTATLEQAIQQAQAEEAKRAGAVYIQGLEESNNEFAAEKARIEAEKNKLKIVALQADLDHEKLKSRAQSPEVLKRLRPFTDKGQAQLRASAWVLDESATPAPVSYKALTASMALNPNPNCRELLVRMACNNLNDRPHWTVDNSESDFVKQAQRDLVELGPVLVELNLLQP